MFPYVTLGTPKAVSTLHCSRAIVWFMQSIIFLSTSYFNAKIAVIAGYIWAKWATMSCCTVPIVHVCIRAHSKMRSLRKPALMDDLLGQNPYWSSLDEDTSKLFIASLPIKNLRHVLNSATTSPTIQRVWICQTLGFFSSIESVINVQC